MINISELRHLCHDKNIAITKHANNRLKERNITIDDIKSAIQSGEIIRQYEDDKPFPSCLILGVGENNTHIHVVASMDADVLYIITSYYPNLDEWESDLKTRRR